MLELVAADLTQKRTLQPGMFDGVRALISCSAVKVAPKEGDTADRAKYMQGIKFYDPEIVGDTPESVEKVSHKHTHAAGWLACVCGGLYLVMTDRASIGWMDSSRPTIQPTLTTLATTDRH